MKQMELPENHNDLGWRRINEDDSSTFPKVGEYVLLSISDFNIPCVGRCEGSEDEGYVFYDGDNERPLSSYGLFVNGWMPLPVTLKDF